MYQRLAFLCLLLAAALPALSHAQSRPAADGAPADTAQASAASFSKEIQPLLADTFAPLLTEDDSLRVDTWQHLLEGSEHGEVLIPYDAENSLIVEVAKKAAANGQPGAPTEEEIARVSAWIEAGAKSDAGAVPYADADPLLYAANQDEALISVIDMERNLVIRTVDLTELGFSENAKPHHIAVEPGGAHWYVSLIGENRILKFDRENNLVGQVEFEVPGMMVVDSSSGRLLVGRSMSAVNPPRSIGIIDRDSLRLSEMDVFFPRPHAIAVAPTGEHVYSASLAENRIATVDLAAERAELSSMEGPLNTLVQFAVAPDGEQMAAGGQMSGRFFFFDTGGPTPTVTDTLALGGQPWHPVYTPDGRRVYVPRKTANEVSVLDAENPAVEAVVSGRGLAEPHGSAVRPDGRYVYVSNNNRKGTYTPRYDLPGNENAGTVAVIDTQTNEIVKVIEIENYPTGLGARPAD